MTARSDLPSRTPFRHRLDRAGYASTAWLLLVVLVVIAAVRAPYLLTNSGVAGLIATSAPLVLAAMAMTATALVGSGVNLSAGPTLVLVNVLLVRFLFERQIGDTWLVVLIALGVGVVIEVAQALIITLVRIEPVIVTLSAFLAISGLDLVILSKPSGQAPNWLSSWGSGSSIASSMTFVLLGAIVAWVLVGASPALANVRLVGSNARTAFVSGVPVALARFVAHTVSGLLIGSAGLAYTGLIASGDPSQSATYTLAATTALVLGGTSLAGGRGGILGSVPAAFAVALISFVIGTFSLGVLSGFVTQLVYGLILVLALSVGAILPRVLDRRTGARS